ncbi:MAG TPA: YqgE/AlgH family protein [Rhabdochlamydiaceae bacterium]|nr:YqgE/AlgH family protein [Rhabdochlamydiaceae bacterium]
MPEQVPYSNLSKGTLLIASPDIESGIFFRSVLILCEHTPSGSFGIIINKPLEVQLPEDLLNLEKQANSHVTIRAGGPIQPNQMMLVHSAETMAEQALKLCDGVYLGGDLQFLQEAINAPAGPYVHLCFGYTGWPAGQLEREFLSGNWFLHPGSAHYVFEVPPDKMWRTLLREMGGKYAMLSMIPEDLSLN